MIVAAICETATPSCLLATGARNLQKDKASVLGHTVEYLKQLTTERQELIERRRELQAVIRQQEEELSQLRPSNRKNSQA